MTKKDREVEQLKHQLARALADYQNLQKRVARESEDVVKRGYGQLFGKLLPVLDILERASSHVKEEGLGLAVGLFKQILSDFAVREIQVAPQEKFDPKLHEAVDVVSGKKEGLIAEIVAKGYMFGDEILRPAQVKVYGKIEKKEKLKTEMLREDYV